jgi:16S rRNA (guanine527-N7)-methyltransferase
MPTLPTSRIADLLTPYVGHLPLPKSLYDQLSTYLDLLLKWNARTNLTAIRDPEQIVHRHFGESLFAAQHIAPRIASLGREATLLDFGSGAGLPGLPIQLALPQLRVTLAESQHKKSSFLREVIRTLALPTLVHAARVEDLPSIRLFDIITLRAVDNPAVALAVARQRVLPFGWLVTLSGTPTPGAENLPLPHSASTFLTLEQTTEQANDQTTY